MKTLRKKERRTLFKYQMKYDRILYINMVSKVNFEKGVDPTPKNITDRD